jgi:hypothetical protein
MAYLFEITEKVVFPNPETLLISPFKDIWDRDNSEGKKVALKELTYIEFMTSQKKSNPYKEYPHEKRQKVLLRDIIQDDNWMADELIHKAISKIDEFQKDSSATYSYYMSAKIAADRMKQFFESFNIKERNDKTGNPIYKPRDITAALNDTEKVLNNLNNLKKKVEEELYEESKMRADKQISPFADPSSLNQM